MVLIYHLKISKKCSRLTEKCYITGIGQAISWTLKEQIMKKFYVVEAKNPLAVHLHANSRDSAQRWIDVLAPVYCAKGYFMDKTLTPSDFIVKETSK
jgi:hypothetical protein